MTAPALDAEPACPGPAEALPDTTFHAPGALRAERRPFDDIPRGTWTELADRTPWATPFSAWAFHRAWWDAYGTNAHEEMLAVLPADAPAGSQPVAIVPLMHRHEVEPSDALTHTRMRRGDDHALTPVPPNAKAVFFGASYHADYATILADPTDLPAVTRAVASYVAGPDAGPWDAVDLRRLRCADPTGDLLAVAFGELEMANGWTLNVEREDVSPVLTLPQDVDIEGFLGTLGKKQRHEIRRKVRRAQAVGEIRLEDSTDPLRDLDAFVELHQKRWGDDGLFRPGPGGEQSLVFFRRLFELFGTGGPLRLTFLSVGDRRIATGIHFDTGDELLYYNAGVDPDARDLSPGVLMVYAYVVRALANRTRRLDFLRGNEPYKYDWGATDEPIRRVLVRRSV